MREKIHPAWINLFKIFTIMFTLHTIPYSIVYIFIEPIATDFGVSRMAANLILTMRSAGCIFMIFFINFFIDRFNLKKIMGIGIVGAASMLFLSSFTKSIYQLYFTYFMLGLLITFSSFIVLSMVINNWFVEKVSFATGIMAMGSDLGGAVLSFLTGILLVRFGWRMTIRQISIFALIMSLIAWKTIDVYPSELGYKPYGVKKDEEHFRWGPMYTELRTKKYFWISVVCTVLLCNFNYIVMLSLPDYLTSIGYSVETASSVVAISFFAMALMELVLGYFYDRFGIAKVLFVTISFLILGYLTLLKAENPRMLPLLVLFFVPGWCNMAVAPQVVSIKLFGNKDYANNLRVFVMANMMGGTITPFLSGLAYDLTNSHRILYQGLLIPALALLIIFQITIKKVKAEIGDMEKIHQRIKA